MRNKSSFLCFIFSMVPGAGQMYLGLMNHGILYMASFVGIIAIASLFYVEQILVVLPIIWCVSFFDVWNKKRLTDEEFSREILKDRKILKSFSTSVDGFFKKKYVFLGGVLVFLGAYILFNNFLLPVLSEIFERFFDISLWRIREYFGTIIIAAVFVYFGMKLMRGKNMTNHAQYKDFEDFDDDFSEINLEEDDFEEKEEEGENNGTGKDDAEESTNGQGK